MLSEWHLSRLVDQVGKRGNDGRRDEDRDDDCGPEPGDRQHAPSDQQQQCERGWDKAASQVVEYLPLRQHRKRIALAVSVRALHVPPEPPDKLPVAANPATPAGHVGAVARWKLFVQLGVAEQSGSRVASFQEIVTQNAVCGKASVERAFE